MIFPENGLNSSNYCRCAQGKAEQAKPWNFNSKFILGLYFLRFCYYEMCFYYFLKLFIYLFLGRGEGRDTDKGEKHQCVVASCVPSTGDVAHNPDMCPDWKSYQRPFASQSSAQSTKPHQPGMFLLFYTWQIYYV